MALEALIPRRRFHRTVFVAAGLYNLGWGALSSLFPQWLFRFAHMPDLNHGAIFAAMAMIVGVYGFLYLEVARAPEHGFAIAAVGLLGKVLGPLGLVVLLTSGEWPVRTVVLCLTNDVIWWIPFGLYLRDSRSAYLRATS
jgi:hypothetical protein